MIKKEYQLVGHELKTPLINAAGLINGPEADGLLRDVATLAASEIGAITVGSWTMLRRLGNAALFGEPTYHYDHQSGEMTNALGLPNVGLDAGEQLIGPIKAEAGNKPVIFSVSPTLPEANIGDSIDQSRLMVARLFSRGAELVELNVSCPNIVDQTGGRKPIMGHDPETMARLAEGLAGDLDSNLYGHYLGLKLPPYISPKQKQAQPAIATIIKDGPFGFVVTANTIPGNRPVDDQDNPRLTVPGGGGGLSGPATKDEGRRQLNIWRNSLPKKPLLSALGVFGGQEVAARMTMGATAAEMNSRFWQSSNWKRTVTEILVELSDHLDG